MSYRHLTRTERDVIHRMLFHGSGNSEIARLLGRAPSTISRERRRNAGCGDRYWPDEAQTRANARRRAHLRRPKTGDSRLMAHVGEKLEMRWSPQQIAGRLEELPPADLAGARISHQTIYRWIWSDSRRAGRYRPFLRVARKKRRKPYGKPSKRGQIPNRTSIEQRPAEANDRSRLGDWEGDTVVGKGRSGYLATCVDRSSRYVIARKLADASAASVNAALHDAMRRLPPELRQTLTVDNGREFAKHQKLARLLDMGIYFAHPYHSWERGTNENTNGLIRQYLPKSQSFRQLTNWQLAAYILELNNRPRKCLNYRTPAEIFWRRSVALTM